MWANYNSFQTLIQRKVHGCGQCHRIAACWSYGMPGFFLQDVECKIFTLWEYKGGPPLSVTLNVEGTGNTFSHVSGLASRVPLMQARNIWQICGFPGRHAIAKSWKPLFWDVVWVCLGAQFREYTVPSLVGKIEKGHFSPKTRMPLRLRQQMCVLHNLWKNVNGKSWEKQSHGVLPFWETAIISLLLGHVAGHYLHYWPLIPIVNNILANYEWTIFYQQKWAIWSIVGL